MEIFSDSAWQMTLGERAAVEGILAQRKPKLAIEIGTGEGDSLLRTAAHSEQVHSFGSTALPSSTAKLSNVIHHAGDRRQSLPSTLRALAEKETNIDFVLVADGVAAGGVRRDLVDLLASPAVADTIILICNTSNEQVRADADSVHYAAYPKVGYVNLDFVPGYLVREPGRAHEIWGGLGLVVVDATRTAYFPATPVVENRYYETGHLYPEMRDLVIARERGKPTSPDEAREQRTLREELTEIRDERNHYRNMYEIVVGSTSWKLTAPLRAARAKSGT